MTVRLVFLGTGTPNPDPSRQGPAIAVVVGDQSYIFDCGVGVVRQAVAASERGVSGLSVENLTHLFVTHLHSDHTLGMPDMILTPAVTGRTGPVHVFGPPGTRAMVDHILLAWREDVELRLYGGEPAIADAYKVEVREWMEGEDYSDEHVRIVPFAVTHGAWKHALGYRIETADEVVVLSGDTVPSENLIKFGTGCKVLVHEAYSALGLSKREPAWQAYHSAYHTSGLDVGRIAERVNPEVLFLNHVLPFGESPEQVAEEVRSSFGGDVRIAEDLDSFEL